MNLRIFLYLTVLFACIFYSAVGDDTNEPAIGNEDETRTWADAQGRAMQATLVGVDMDTNEVIFKKDTGRRYRFSNRAIE